MLVWLVFQIYVPEHNIILFMRCALERAHTQMVYCIAAARTSVVRYTSFRM